MIYGPPLRQPVSPDTVVCAFDLHRVLFHRDWLGIFRYVLHMPHKLFGARYILNPFFWIHVFIIRRQTSVGDDIFERLTHIYPGLASFKADFIALENTQKVDQQVLHITIKLKAHGYSLYVLSNIGERAFIELAKKNHDLFHLFDHIFLPQKSHNYRQKPGTEFYQDFLAFLQKKGDGDKSVLFIDDRIPNLEGAAKVGITGLYFTNADSLLEHLKRLSVITMD